jgi:glycosyltransferase involved in cell wall biosynthesis
MNFEKKVCFSYNFYFKYYLFICKLLNYSYHLLKCRPSSLLLVGFSTSNPLRLVIAEKSKGLDKLIIFIGISTLTILSSFMNPVVTVIIPTYNRSKQLCKAIESVLSQTYPSVELLVIDDGSDDDTSLQVAKYKPARYFRQERQGQAAARSLGLKHAIGSYIASLDSDDQWQPKFLETCIEKLEKDNLDFVFANWMQELEKDNFIDRLKLYNILEKHIPPTGGQWISLNSQILRNVYLTECPSPSSSLVIRRRSMTDGWRGLMNIADDWYMLMDMIFARDCKAAFITSPLWYKCVDGSNIFDGRDVYHVLKSLWVDDSNSIYVNFCSKFTKKERCIFKKFLSENYTKLSYFELRHHRRLIRSVVYLMKALSLNLYTPFYLFKNHFSSKTGKEIRSLPLLQVTK